MNAGKQEEVAERIGYVAIALSCDYAARGGCIEVEDFEQIMWVALLERIDDQTFTARPVNQVVNKLAWVARDWARREFNLYTNRTVEVEGMTQDDDSANPWEFFEMEIDSPYPGLDLASAIEAAITADAGTTERIARSLMAGYSKRETADRLGIGPSLVTYHLQKMRKVLSQARLAA